MKKSKAHYTVLLLAAILMAALCISAFLQYQWLNQLSVAEEVRIRSSVENAARQFGNEVNQEAVSALFTFVVPAPRDREELAERLAERWVEWYATSNYADLVKNVYWVENAGSGSESLFRYNQDELILEPMSEWGPANDEYPGLESFFEGDIISPVPLSRSRRNGGPLLPFDPEPWLQRDHLFIVFDKEYISDSWIPALIKRLFQVPEHVDYDIFIADRHDESNVIFASHQDGRDHEKSDIQLNIGPPDTNHMIRLVTRMMSRSSLTSEARGRSPGGGRGLRAGPVPPRLWTLHITHKSGALETAVTNVRRRNVGISFLVLLVLGSSVGLILVYTRRIQHLADQQMAFVAGVSHDIKTPIAVMHAVGENMRDGLVTELEETQEYGHFVVDQSRSLLNTVDQVLSYAGITLGAKWTLECDVDINRVVQQSLSRIEPDLKDIELELNLDSTLPSMHGDEDALASVVQNLVQNAVKYSGETSYIGLSTFEEQGRLHLTVKDTGLGIAPEDQPHIFEPFYRAARIRASQIRGNGLGLSIVKNIVEAHNGTVTFKSSPDLGTTFHVTFPGN